jgi:hypothetical protein
MRDKLIPIIQELKDICITEKLNITDSELLDYSIRLFNTSQINQKKLNNELSPKERLLENNNTPATPNQKWVLRKNNIEIKDNLTKKEAYELIKKLKSR